MTIIYEGYTQIPAHADLDALYAAVAAVNPAVYNASMAEFNVRDSTFGALGNDSHDDTSAFSGALAAAGVAGGLVRVPRGIYKVTSQMAIPSNVFVQGDGAGASVVHATGMGGLIVFKGTGVSQSVCQDFAITGTLGEGIEWAGCDSVGVFRCAISGATVPIVATGYSAGIHSNASTNVTLESNVFSGNGIPSETTAGWDILCNPLTVDGYKKVNIRNNKCLSTGAYGNIGCFNIQESEVSGNFCSGAKYRVIAGNGGNGILLYAAGYFTPWSALTNYVVGNVVYIGNDQYRSIQNGINQPPASSPAFWTAIDHAVRDNKVHHNTIQNTEAGAIYCANGRRTAVFANKIENVATVAPEVSLPQGGININGGSADVYDNTINGTIRSGISYISGTDGGSITSNTILFATGVAGIKLAVCTGVKVDNNRIEDGTAGIMSSDPASLILGCSITNNSISRMSARGILVYSPLGTKVDGNNLRLIGSVGIEIDNGLSATNNSVSNNTVSDANQAAGGYHAIIGLSPGSLYNSNTIANTQALGHINGLSLDVLAAPGSQANGNGSRNARGLDFVIPAGMAAAGNQDTANTLGAFTLGVLSQLTGSVGASSQLLLGSIGAMGSIGREYSTSDIILCENAMQLATTTWHQIDPATSSKVIKLSVAGDFEMYTAAPGTGDAIFATFWGPAKNTFGGKTFNGYKINGTQVLTTRITGWTAMTGTATKAAAGFDTASVTLPQLAQVVKALLDSSLTHGFNGA